MYVSVFRYYMRAAQIFYSIHVICFILLQVLLGVAHRSNPFAEFDDLFDLTEQETIRNVSSRIFGMFQLNYKDDVWNISILILQTN